MNQGKLVIVTIVVVGMALSAFAWWTRYSRSQQVLEVWGADAVIAIRSGDKVELLRLVAADRESSMTATESQDVRETLSAGRDKLYVEGTADIADAPGLIHARHHLIHEKGFHWNEPRPTDCQPNWESALRFTHEENVATMLLDFECQRIYLVERDVEVGMQPIAPSIQKFLSGIQTDE